MKMKWAIPLRKGQDSDPLFTLLQASRRKSGEHDSKRLLTMMMIMIMIIIMIVVIII